MTNIQLKSDHEDIAGTDVPKSRSGKTGSSFAPVLYIILASQLLWGCAISEQGKIDYRKGELPDPDQNDLISKGGVEADHKVRLIRQAVRQADANARIKPQEGITIRLRKAFVKQFSELPLNPFRGFQSNGEIAVVVNAFEMGKGRDFNFSPKGIEEGRLVFFSDDVEEGQTLNFDNMPIYGPITYDGGPLALDLAIIEIDTENKQLTALLSTLASEGAILYPPAAPVLGLLETLGSAFLKGTHNDVEFRFAMALDSDEGYPGLHHPVVEVGNYVLIREEVRQSETPWNKIQLDSNTGLLMIDENGTNDWQPYTLNSYITVQIDRASNSVQLDLSQNTFGEFMKTLEDQETAKAENLQETLATVVKLARSRVQIRNFSRARDLLAKFESARKGNEDNGPNKSGQLQALYDLNRMIVLKTPEDTAGDRSASVADLSDDQAEFVLQRLRFLAKPVTLDEVKRFDLANFRSPDVNADSTLDALIKALIPQS